MTEQSLDTRDFDDTVNGVAAALKDAGYSNNSIVHAIGILTKGYVLCERCLHTSWHPKVSIGQWTAVCKYCALDIEEGEE